MNTSKEDMLAMRRNYAMTQPTKSEFGRFSIAPPQDNRTYSTNKDKSGLSKEARARVEDMKDAMTYPEEQDLW